MILSREYKALFALLRSGLWDRTDPSVEAVFPLSAAEWEDVFRLSREQTVFGIVFRGMEYLPDEYAAPLPFLAKWTAHADRLEEQNRRMNGVLKSVLAHIDRAGATAVLQKGQGVARMYPEPLLRECGDIDLYFPDDCALDPLAGLPGSDRRRMPDGSWEYEYDGVVIERHTRLLDIVSPLRQKYLRSLVEDEGYETVHIGGEDGFTAVVPSPKVNLLLLGSHILKHAFGVGIGLRQVCDMAVAQRYYASRVSDAEMEEVYRRTGILKWSRLLDCFIEEFIYSDKPKKSTVLLQIILKGGNFGAFTEGRESASRGLLSRKWSTFRSFVGNMGFALRYAPGEWLWTLARLAGGQVR